MCKLLHNRIGGFGPGIEDDSEDAAPDMPKA